MPNEDITRLDGQTETMIFYGFRYCLGRASHAVCECADYLVANWKRLSPWAREKIHKEIKVAFENKQYGHEQDREDWQRVLDMPLGG